MLNIAICDDIDIIAKGLAKRTEKFFKEKGIEIKTEIFTDSEQLDKKCREFCYDLLLLDIDMPGLSGFQIADRIRKYNNYVTIIFVTGCDELVYDAFLFRPFAFIRKSRLDEEFNVILQRYINHVERQNKVYEFETHDGNVKVKANDIVYMYTIRHNMYLYLNSGETVIIATRRYTLNQLEKLLLEYGFIRTHKEYIINYRYIKALEDKYIILCNDTRLPISRRRTEIIRNQYMMLSRSESIL